MFGVLGSVTGLLEEAIAAFTPLTNEIDGE